MSFLSGFAKWATLGLGPALIGGISGAKKKVDPYADLMNQLNPLIQAQTKIATNESNAGIANVDKATGDYDYVANYLKSLFSGSDDQLLSLLDASGATANLDENTQQLSELGVRGGQRAASLGQAGFSKDAMLNKLLAQLRFTAPDKLAGIAQGIGTLGLGELGSSTSANNAAISPIFGIEDLRQKDKDRHAAMISSIFSALGSAAGAGLALCVSIGDSFISTPEGKVPIIALKKDDKVLSFDKLTGEQVIRTVIRTRISKEKQLVKVIGFGSRRIRVTPSHAFYTSDFEEVKCENLIDSDFILVMTNNTRNLLPIKLYGEDETTVKIIKLDNEDENFPFIVNDFICADDYTLAKIIEGK